jgi:succinoglycan biosynthesis protein ExoA
MYHKSVFEKVGFFDENFDAAEDVEFNYRVEKQGIQCYTSPELKVYYYPRDNLKSLLFQLMRYGKGRARFFFKYPARMHLSTLAPPLFVLFTVILALASIFTGTVVFQFLVVYLFLYAVILLAESARINFVFKTDYLLLVPIIIATIHTGLGLGFINGIIDNLIKILSDNQ